MTKEQLLEIWKGIPAPFIAALLTAKGKGSDWQQCSKDYMAGELTKDNRRREENFDDVDMEELAAKARSNMKAAKENAQRTRAAEEKQKERKELLSLSREDIHNRLMELVQTEAGQQAVQTQRYQEAKAQARRVCELDTDQAQVKKYVSQYLALRGVIEASSQNGETTP
jgi:hypothetical protein